ncbi:MAG: outer membrane homotrimeric porin, partial [Desulfohalobiaceae bacterium]
DNLSFTDDSSDTFTSLQRVRTYFTFAASEHVKAVWRLEVGDARFGQNVGGTAGNDWALGGDGVNIETKNAYLEYLCPFTGATVKAGLQGVALPSVVGNPIVDNDVAGVVVSYPVNDMASVLGGWLRSQDNSFFNPDDEQDVAFVAVPLAMDGISLVPYFAYSWVGSDISPNGYPAGVTGDDIDVWWAGVNLAVSMFDPIGIYADFIYGDADTGDLDLDHDGFYLALAADMKMDMMTPMVWFTYATGADDDDYDYMPFFAGDWYPTSFGTDLSRLDNTGVSNAILTIQPQGLWTVGLQLGGISFIEGLSHDFRIMYAEGTNEAGGLAPLDGAGLTDDDSLIEVNFDTTYMMYETLAAIVELGYINPDIDAVSGEEDAWRLAVGLKYDF